MQIHPTAHAEEQHQQMESPFVRASLVVIVPQTQYYTDALFPSERIYWSIDAITTDFIVAPLDASFTRLKLKSIPGRLGRREWRVSSVRAAVEINASVVRLMWTEGRRGGGG